jgi:hypothetical protein
MPLQPPASTLVGLFCVFGGITLLITLLIAVTFASVLRKRAVTAALAKSRGFAKSPVVHLGQVLHWTHEWQGRRWILGHYHGGKQQSEAVSLGSKGVVLMMHVGGGVPERWGARLTDPPQLWGKGEGREQLASLLNAEVLKAASPLLPHVSVFSGDGLVRGAVQCTVIERRWPDGWHGLGVRVVLPLRPSQARFDQAMADMLSLATALEAAQQAVGARS